MKRQLRAVSVAFVLAVSFPACLQAANVFPANLAIDISTNPVLEITCDSTALSGQYQISTDSGFSGIVYDSGEDEASICSHVAFANLVRGQAYFWRARTRDSGGTLTAWTSETSFTTVDISQKIGILELRDGVKGYAGTRDSDIRGSYLNPSVSIVEWGQGHQNVLRNGRRLPGSSTDEIYRALIYFDISQVVALTPVVSAYLELTGGEHDAVPDTSGVFSTPSSTYQLLTYWGEWDGGDVGCCDFPDTGEVSWTYRAFPDMWNIAGAAGIGIDRSATRVFTTHFRNEVGHKTRSSSDEFIQIVQNWIDSQSTNYGLLLQVDDESLQQILNLGSREVNDSGSRPALVVELQVSELIDLSLDFSPSVPNPAVGETFDIDIVVSNDGPDDADGIVVVVPAPMNFTVGSGTPSAGSFNTGTGIWTIPSITSSSSVTLTLSGSATSGTDVIFTTEIVDAVQLDADSYPDNGRNEDDQIVVSVPLIPDPMADVIVDNLDSNTEKTGTWKTSGAPNPWAGHSTYSDSNGLFTFQPNLAGPGTYEIFVWFTYYSKRSMQVPYRVEHDTGTAVVPINQRDPSLGGDWVPIGTYELTPGVNGNVSVSSENGQASADAVRYVVVDVGPPDMEAPTAPTGLTATDVRGTEIDLQWNASMDNVGVTGYIVYVDMDYGNPVATVTSGTSYTVTNLVPDTSYMFEVRAIDAAANPSGLSNLLTEMTDAPDTEAPTTPTGLTATDVRSSEIDLQWNASMDNVGVTGYIVYIDMDYGNPVATVTSGTSYTVTNLLPSTSYMFEVRAIDAASNPSGLSNPLTEMTASGPLAEIIVDDLDFNVVKSGSWKSSGSPNPYAAHSSYTNSTGASFTFQPALSISGNYEIFIWFTYHANRSTNVPFRVENDGVTVEIPINQRDVSIAGDWISIGHYDLTAGVNGNVIVSGENGQASADAVRYVLD